MIDPSDRALPIEPIDRTLPTDPMDSTEPFDPMLSTEELERDRHRRRRLSGGTGAKASR